MKPIKLTLKGFRGIASGMGKPEVVVDLTAVEGSLIAFVGPNGAGKTTIIDNLHPFRVMPSHAASPTPTSFSFYDQLSQGEDGLKELEWSLGGRLFLSSVRMKAAGKTKRQEAYLFEVLPNGETVPYHDPVLGFKSDGKADTYDKAVEVLLGKPEVFFSTVFSAQGKRAIHTMTNSEVKHLLSSMQGTDKIKLLSERAGEVIKGLRPALAANQALAYPLEQAASRLDAFAADVLAGTEKIAHKTEESKVLKDRIDAQSAKVLSIKHEASRQQELLAQRESIGEQIKLAQSELQAADAAFDTRAKESVNSDLQAIDRAKTQIKSLQQSLGAIQRRAEELALIIRSEQPLLQKQAKLESLKKELTAKNLAIDEHWVDDQKITDLRESIANLQAALGEMGETGKSLAAIVASAKATAAILSDVPCRGTTYASNCQLIAQAIDAERKLPSQVTQLDEVRISYRGRKANSDLQTEELTRLLAREKTLQTLKREKTDLELEIAEIRVALATLPEIDRAKAAMPGVEVEVKNSRKLLAEAEAACGELVVAHEQKKAKRVDEKLTALAPFSANIARMQMQLADLPLPVQTDAITREESELNRLRDQLSDLGDELEVLRMTLVGTQEKHTHAKLASAQLELIAKKSALFSSEISAWTLLSKACGNDGIIAMTIDDCGPSISAIANRLLTDCYGGRFLIRISTQEATATGILKESFCVHVEDVLRGEQKLLDEMSGGEKVWINECLVRAMALFTASTSGSRSQTLFSDESDGALDDDKKRQFMAMKRAVLQLGGYERDFIITHTPQLLQMCDGVIDVTKL